MRSRPMSNDTPTADPVRLAAQRAAEDLAQLARAVAVRLGDGGPVPPHAVARLLLDTQKAHTALQDGLARLG